jgi:hypothetical protein
MNSNLSYYADGDIDFLVIDERCPGIASLRSLIGKLRQRLSMN